MYPSDERLNPKLDKKLAAFRSVPARQAEAAERGRATFIEQVNLLAGAVSEAPTRRHNGWIEQISTLFQRKEHPSMFSPLVTAFVIACLVFGGAGVTVQAAQDSLPGQALYGIKTFTEDARLEITSDPWMRLELQLEFAEKRVDELQTLLQKNLPPPAMVLTRMQAHLDRSIQLAAGLEEGQHNSALVRIRLSLKAQEQTLLQTRTQAGGQADTALTFAREMVQARLRLIEGGLSDPQTFRERYRQHSPGNPPSQTPGMGGGFGPGPSNTRTPTPGSGYGPGRGPNASQTPGAGNGYGPGPYVTGTPTPGGGYGPGPGPDPSQTPGSGYQQGPGPNATQTAGSGPGPAPCSTCTPQADPGPNPEPSPGGGGNGGPQQTPGEGQGGGNGGRQP